MTVNAPLRVVVNGKFLSAGPTGVHRVAEQLVRHVQARIDADEALARRLQLELWVPPDVPQSRVNLGVALRRIGKLSGVGWEQITLPLAARGRLILSLCNVGPILSRNAVTMFHDAQVRISPRSYSLPFRLWYRIHQGITGRRHRRILTVSEFSRGQLDAYGIADATRIGVVLNGVDHDAAQISDDAALRRSGLIPGRYVAALANTQVHKNIALLLRAFADPQLAGLKLALFGPATKADFTALGVAVPDNAVFVGRVTDAELHGLYQAALCIAFPSLTEGFGLPPLEAMLAGCPAIVAPEGALPQVCGDAAQYVDARDDRAWTAAILELSYSPTKRTAMIAAGQLQAAKFTWDRAASQLIAELLALAPAPASA